MIEKETKSSDTILERVASGKDLSVRNYLLQVFTQNLLSSENNDVAEYAKILRCSEKTIVKQLMVQFHDLPAKKSKSVLMAEAYEVLSHALMDVFYKTLPAPNVRAKAYFSQMVAFDKSLSSRLRYDPQAVVHELQNLSAEDKNKELLETNIATYLRERLSHAQTESMRRGQRLDSMLAEVTAWQNLDFDASATCEELRDMGFKRQTIEQFTQHMTKFFTQVKDDAVNLLVEGRKAYHLDLNVVAKHTAETDKQLALLPKMSAEELYNWLYVEACRLARINPFELVK